VFTPDLNEISLAYQRAKEIYPVAQELHPHEFVFLLRPVTRGNEAAGTLRPPLLP
jgi:hypothetical protein